MAMFIGKTKYFIAFIVIPVIVISILLLVLASDQINKQSDNSVILLEKEVVAITPSSPVEKPKEKVVVLLAGDVMLGRTVMEKAQELGDSTYPFAKVADETNSVDIVFVNLENPIIENCPVHTDGYKFCSSKEMVEGLVVSGIDIVTLANNHSSNYGQEGLVETVELLDSKDILSTGLGKLETITVKDTTFGFLGFDLLSNVLKTQDLELIKESSEKVDVLIVGVHWGVEYTDKPIGKQRDWASFMVEKGADVIVGHHPHWVQEIEYIDDVPVYYSLGNFVFDQMWSEETKKGLVVKLTYEDGEIVNEELLPTYMSFHAQPEFVD